MQTLTPPQFSALIVQISHYVLSTFYTQLLDPFHTEDTINEHVDRDAPRIIDLVTAEFDTPPELSKLPEVSKQIAQHTHAALLDAYGLTDETRDSDAYSGYRDWYTDHRDQLPPFPTE